MWYNSTVETVVIFGGLGLAWAYIGFMVVVNKLEKNAKKRLT